MPVPVKSMKLTPKFKLRSAQYKHAKTMSDGRYTPDKMKSSLSVDVPVPFNMEYSIDNIEDKPYYCGWSTDFPGVVVQADTLEQLEKEFVISVKVLAQYLHDTNGK
jgi:hypothetical protein